MKVCIITPNTMLVENDFDKVNADGNQGNFCVLPRHVDYLAPLIPGILILTDSEGNQRFFANDFGTLIKCGSEVRINVLRAIESESLEHLQNTVTRRFRKMDETERAGAAAVASL